MQAIADALVYAVTYINLRSGGGEDYDDGDVSALESIAGELVSATEDEKSALAAAAERHLTAEREGARRPEFINDYSTWMADMFGDEEWEGNKRKRKAHGQDRDSR